MQSAVSIEPGTEHGHGLLVPDDDWVIRKARGQECDLRRAY